MTDPLALGVAVFDVVSAGVFAPILASGDTGSSVPERSSSTDFVGRRVELAAFERAVDAAGVGRPGVLLVGGDAGIGKSTLVVEGARRAGAELVVGRCVPMGGDVIPLAPLVELLRNVRRSKPDALAGPALVPLREWAAQEAVSGAPAPAGVLFGGVLELVGSLPDDGVAVVALEDLHWADPLTWDLFDFLARNLVDERVVLVGTYRANEVAANAQQRRRLGELARLPAVDRIHLGGLARDEVAARIEALTGTRASFSFVDEVLARGQGNPFFTTELVDAHLAGQAIPAVLSDLIAADLADLDETGRLVLGVIAAVGRDTDHDLLVRVAEVDEERLEAALRAAIVAQLLVVDSDTDAYRFRHALIGEVAYAELLPPQRRRLHRRIATALRGAGRHTCWRGPTEPASSLFTSIALATSRRRSPRCSPPPTPPRRWRRARRCATSSGRWSCGTRPVTWRLASRAALGCGRRPTSPAGPPATSGPPRSLARRSATDRRRGARRGVTNGSDAICGRPGDLEQSAAEFAVAAALLPEDAGPEAALVYAGLGQAELMLAPLRRRRGARPSCLRAVGVTGGRAVGMVDGSTRPRHRRGSSRRPGDGRRAVS